MRLIFTCFFVSFIIALHAQIQDSFNLCVGYNEVHEDYTHLIPNPDFEEFACCPSAISQMHCVKDWTQPSNPTSDYMNTCDFVFQAAQSAGLVPFPSGEGIVGTLFAAGWQEYIASCLNEPIIAGKRLFLKFKIAYTPITNAGAECNAPPHSSIDIVVYGHNNCGSMSLPSNGCPLAVDPQWKIIGKSRYQPLSEWREIIIEINTDEDVNAIIIGSPCSLPYDYTLSGCLAYFYYDDFTLGGNKVFPKEIVASEVGHPCSNDYQIIAEIDTTGGEWQWFLDGEILAGETDPTIDISQKNYTSGVYSLRYIIGEYCMLYQKEVNLEEMQLIHWEANIIHDEGNGTGSVAIIIDEEWPPYEISWAHGPDLFTMSDLEPGEYFATVTDAVGCTSSIEVIIDPKSLFVTVWNTELSGGVTNKYGISIPGIGENYYIFWQEIDRPENRNLAIGNNTTVITFPNPGIYRVSIAPGKGTFHRIHFNSVGDKRKIINILQWGDIEWSSFGNAFTGCENLDCNSLDQPLMHQLTNMSEMFSGCVKLDGPANMDTWDVSNVTNMREMFYRADIFNQDIGNWNVGNVDSMNQMFNRSLLFNQDIGGWDVSNVINMDSMFFYASSFNQNIGNWDVGNVTHMRSMFERARLFNQDIGSWNVGNVIHMNNMFTNANVFNRNIGNWDVSNVINMRHMFELASSFNQDIGNWNVENITNMEGMFDAASSFNQDIGRWNVGKVTKMRRMFEDAILFNQDIGDWNVENVTDMTYMFSNAKAFNQDIGRWNVSKVSSMGDMFEKAISFNQDIGSWNVANVTTMSRMFASAILFNQDITNWNLAKATNLGYMFEKATSFNQNISKWNVSNVWSFTYMFNQASAFNQNLGNWNIAKVSTIVGMFDLSGMKCDNYSATLIGWNSNPSTPNGRIFGAESLKYGTEAEAARDNLINAKGWRIEEDSPSGIECLMSVNIVPTETGSQIKLFPNPFKNQLVVETSSVEQVRIVLYDQLSRKIIQQSFFKSTTIDTEHLPQGLYIFQFKNNHRTISSGKIVKH